MLGNFILRKAILYQFLIVFQHVCGTLAVFAFVGYQKRKRKKTEESLLFKVVSLEYSSQEEVSNINFLPV